ncbi:FG-GAP-like repeat-containing protein [Nannocystis pusilla]|uniref:FG-GAP-like repeat-containing protein n=1 Tax=Nannocystis pusilla TaxID=889268 RepID=UPI003B761E39
MHPLVGRSGRWQIDPSRLLPGVEGVSQKVELVDLDADGFVDLVFADSRGSATGSDADAQPNQLLRNDEGQGFSEWPGVLEEPDNAYVIKAGDIDGDGDPDLVVGVHFHGQSHILFHDDGAFVRHDILPGTPCNIGDSTRSIPSPWTPDAAGGGRGAAPGRRDRATAARERRAHQRLRICDRHAAVDPEPARPRPPHDQRQGQAPGAERPWLELRKLIEPRAALLRAPTRRKMPRPPADGAEVRLLGDNSIEVVRRHVVPYGTDEHARLLPLAVSGRAVKRAASRAKRPAEFHPAGLRIARVLAAFLAGLPAFLAGLPAFPRRSPCIPSPSLVGRRPARVLSGMRTPLEHGSRNRTTRITTTRITTTRCRCTCSY